MKRRPDLKTPAQLQEMGDAAWKEWLKASKPKKVKK